MTPPLMNSGRVGAVLVDVSPYNIDNVLIEHFEKVDPR